MNLLYKYDNYHLKGWILNKLNNSRYCQSLGGDRFSSPLPIWFCKKLETSEIYVSVLLPLASTIAEAIQGPKSKSLRRAKSACALEAVQLLHQKEQLDDHLRPALKLKTNLAVEPALFPNWVEEEKSEAGDPGTKSRRRLHQIKVRWFQGLPKPSFFKKKSLQAGFFKVFVQVLKVFLNWIFLNFSNLCLLNTDR